MKALLSFVVAVLVLAGIGSGIWWLTGGPEPMAQIEYLKATFAQSTGGTAAGNTAESASKLGKVLRDNFEEAQDVYQNGAEAKYE